MTSKQNLSKLTSIHPTTVRALLAKVGETLNADGSFEELELNAEDQQEAAT